MREDPQPFFIVGAARSGTTLLRLVLTHHSQVCECHEMNFVCAYIRDHGLDADPAGYRRYLEHDLGFQMSGYSTDARLGVRDQVRDFLDQRRVMDGAPLVGAVVHHAASVLPEIWPHAKFVHLQRDPRDVARSSVQMGWAGIPWRGAEFWRTADDEWKMIERLVPAERRFEIRFEDFATDSETALDALCAFLGIAFEADMLEIEKTTTYERPRVTSAASWTKAPEDEIRQVEAAIGLDRMTAAGYAPSGMPLLEMTPGTKLRLRLMNFIRLQLDKARRYGILLSLGQFLSRRLPFTGFRRAVTRRIDAVTVRNMK